jgi:hypothetical protein
LSINTALPINPTIKKVKYAYQESPNSENTASPSSQTVERKREHGFIRISISNKTPQTINEKEDLWCYCLGTVSVKKICRCWFNQSSRHRFAKPSYLFDKFHSYFIFPKIVVAV